LPEVDRKVSHRPENKPERTWGHTDDGMENKVGSNPFGSSEMKQVGESEPHRVPKRWKGTASCLKPVGLGARPPPGSHDCDL
jgi:hypothetical protein